MSKRPLAPTAALLLAASILALTASAAPTTPAPAPAAAPAPAVQVAGAEAHNAGTATRDKDTLSVDFPDEDIKTILRNVADLFELNLVVPDTLTGKTSIKLRDVTWRQIFQVVLSPAGYTYVEEGNIIKIVSNETLGQEPVSTEVFILNNAKAQDIKPTVDGLVDNAAGGKILVDTRSNALVVTERPSRMTRIRTIVEQLDKATAQVMIESKFVEVSDSDIRNIGVNWASLQGMRVGVGQINQTWNRGRQQQRTDGNNSTIGSNDSINTTNGNSAGSSLSSTTSTNALSGTSGSTTSTSTNGNILTPITTTTTNSTTNVVTQSTVPTLVPNSTNSITVSSTTPTGSTVTNTQSSGTNSGTSSATTFTNIDSSVVNNLLGLTNTNTQGRLASAVFSASDFNVIISALKTQNNTKIVSNPTIVTLNNTEATINIGSEFPIPSYTYNAERGTFEVSGFTYKPIGVLLKVTPQVNGQGNIRLALEPEISQQNGSTSFGGAGGASIPIIATRKVKTQVSLKDGYTAGIGGLITANIDHGGTKVPVLGSIPVLGRLFSSKSVNDRTSNLLIFITAKTVNSDGAAPEEIFTAESLQAVGMGKAAAEPKK